jgi:hypothetical protein
MLRPALTVAALALAAHTLGCGGDTASSPADAVRAYNGAVADGDGERACARLDAGAQQELRQSTQGQARGSCKQVIELLAAFYDDATKQKLRDAKVAASEQGDRGSARFSSPVGLGGPAREQTYELRRIDGDWKITSLGLSGADLGIGTP